jgi:hypothetical protein
MKNEFDFKEIERYSRKEAILDIVYQLKKDDIRFAIRTQPNVDELESQLKSVLNKIFELVTDIEKPVKAVFPSMAID